jgi:hypothetical protein
VSKEFEEDSHSRRSHSHSHSGSGNAGAGGTSSHRNRTRASAKGSPRQDYSGTYFIDTYAPSPVTYCLPFSVRRDLLPVCNGHTSFVALRGAGSGSGPSSNLSPQSAHSAAETARRRANPATGRAGAPQVRSTLSVASTPAFRALSHSLSLVAHCDGSIRRRRSTPPLRLFSTRRPALSAAWPAKTSPGKWYPQYSTVALFPQASLCGPLCHTPLTHSRARASFSVSPAVNPLAKS